MLCHILPCPATSTELPRSRLASPAGVHGDEVSALAIGVAEATEGGRCDAAERNTRNRRPAPRRGRSFHRSVVASWFQLDVVRRGRGAGVALDVGQLAVGQGQGVVAQRIEVGVEVDAI